MEISVNGATLVIKTGPASFNYPAKDIIFHKTDEGIEIKTVKFVLFKITDHAKVTIPGCVSMVDLFEKLKKLK